MTSNRPACAAPDPSTSRAVRYYLIRGAGGTVIAEGDAAVPAAGTSLMLLVPASRLERGGQYVADIRNAVDANAIIGEYRFTIAP